MKRVTTEEFIRRAKLVHGDTYGYNRTVYVNQNTPVKIYCKKCRKYFLQLPGNHLQGKNCYKCAVKSVHDRQRKSKEQFVAEAKLVHGDKYSYALSKYKSNSEKIKIYCKKCKRYFWQKPNKHLLGQDCPCYKLEKMHNKLKYTTDEFVKLAKKVHGKRYDYSEVEYVNYSTPVKLKCNKCGHYFMQMPCNHLANKGCPYCKSSKGEKTIENWLIANEIRYVFQKRFKDCKDKQQLPFDFYLPDLNICIEYQGRQHYQLWHTGEPVANLLTRQKHDQIKRDYCKKNGILLLEIKYTENIERKLKEAIHE